MLLWILITVMVVTGWGGVIGMSFDDISDQCREANAQIVLDNRQGPLRNCD